MAVIGFSTGAIALDDFATALQLLAPTGARAVELSALRAVELPALLAALPVRLEELRSRYQYISFHAPTNFDDENDLVVQLKIIADMGMNIVVHPDTIHDTSVWRSLGARLCLENMDSRKSTGRTAEELQPYFDQLPEARLCFDIAHARQVDSSMTEAVRILQRFGDRLAQVHISEVNSKGRHFAMSFAAKRAYEPFAARLSLMPVIIESMVERDEIAREISETDKVLNFARSRAVHGSAMAGGLVGSVHRPE
nr:TIM barrel protein [uncultured Devosia sp.]